VTEVGVYRRHKRIARVQHQRDAGRSELAALSGNLLRKLFREFAEDFGKVDAGFLEHAALGQHARPPAAAPFALPLVFAELAGAIGFFQTCTDVVLKRSEKTR